MLAKWSFLGHRFWLRFGRSWDPFWHPSWPKLGPKRFPRHDFSKKVIFQKNERRCSHSTILPSGRHRKRPKIAPRRPQDGLKEVLFRCSISSSILVRFGTHFGAILAPQVGHVGGRFSLFFWTSPQEVPKRLPRGRQETPKRHPSIQETPKRSPSGHQGVPNTAPRCAL